MKPPWTPLGIGWLLAIIVLFVWIVVLLLSVAAPAYLVPLSFILLALAILI